MRQFPFRNCVSRGSDFRIEPVRKEHDVADAIVVDDVRGMELLTGIPAGAAGGAGGYPVGSINYRIAARLDAFAARAAELWRSAASGGSLS